MLARARPSRLARPAPLGGAAQRHLTPLPPYAPEPNPVERVWLFLRERFLSHRLLDGYEAIVAACCEAWDALTPDRLQCLAAHPWIAKDAS